MLRYIMMKGRAADLMMTHASSLRFATDIGGELIPGITRTSRLMMNNFKSDLIDIHRHANGPCEQLLSHTTLTTKVRQNVFSNS
jgi:hypothetical protein